MNMRCPDIELELAGFAAGELDPGPAGQVARHLAGCAGCRDELARELRLRGTLAGLPLVAAPDRLGALEATGPRRRRRPWVHPGLGGLAAAAVLLALLAGLPGPAPVVTAYTPDQVAAARRDAAWTLVLAARILERSERNALFDVFGQRLPRAVAESLGGPAPTPEGGQG